MARPVKWSRDLHPIRERASHSRTETWSRQDIERLFDIGRASAQNLMKAIGNVQTIGVTHFVDRSSLLSFLDAMIAAPSVEEAMRERMLQAEPPPRRKPLRTTLTADLRNARLLDLPGNITLEPGRLEVRADTAVAMLKSLVTLATIMGNDLDRWQQIVEPPRSVETDEALSALLGRIRDNAAAMSQVDQPAPSLPRTPPG